MFQTHAVEIKNSRPVLSLNSSGALSTLVFTNTNVNSLTHLGEFHINHTYLSSNPSKSTIRFGAYPGGDVLTLLADGNVGIGTNDPIEKLHVNGKIRATGQVGWADFVFEDDYLLPDLEHVESEIEKFGHLPGIPSAEEIREDGIDLTEMDSRLFQKIEELTLYLILQNK